jgi:hypothetical protein
MRYHAPCDPDCPKYRRYVDALYNDPMSEGAPLGEIMEEFERNHRRKCERCKEYGVANIEGGE